MMELMVKRGSSELQLDRLMQAIRKLDKLAVVQLFNPKWIKGKAHLIGAYINAVYAFKNKTNRSKNISMEMLLFAACTDQIGKAIKEAGAKSNDDFILFCDNPKLLGKLGRLAKLREFNGRTNKRDDMKILQKMALSRLRAE